MGKGKNPKVKYILTTPFFMKCLRTGNTFETFFKMFEFLCFENDGQRRVCVPVWSVSYFCLRLRLSLSPFLKS